MEIAQVDAANNDDRRNAQMASGLTLETADIERPTWRVQTTGEALLTKWHEILTQMSEGRLAAT